MNFTRHDKLSIFSECTQLKNIQICKFQNKIPNTTKSFENKI